MKTPLAPVYKKHWIFIFLLAGVLFAANHYLNQGGDAKIDRTSMNSRYLKDESFLVLHFSRISSHGRKTEDPIITPEVFQSHLEMLKNSGYNVINAEQVYDFFYKGGKLPKKAVLVTLMGFRENYVYADPVLDKLGMQALMFLDVESMWEKIYTYLSWHAAKGLNKNRWDLGILARLNKNAKTYKPYVEKQIQNLNIRAVTCSLEVDFDNIRNQYALAFQHKISEGYNDRRTSPDHLNMLIVSSKWSAEDLKQVLEKTLSDRSRFEDDFNESRLALDWLVPWGKAFARKGKMILQSKLEETGAAAWLLGTQTWDSLSVEAEYKLVRGKQFWLYARYSDDGNYLRFGQDGNIFYLQERTQWGPVKGLKGYAGEMDFMKPQRIRFMLRDRYAFAYVNGRRLFRQPLSVDSSLERGKVGFSVWDAERGRVYAQINWVRFKKLPKVWLKCSTTEECLETIRGYSEYVSSISPAWFRMGSSGHLEDGVEKYRSFNIHRGYFKMLLVPTIVFDQQSFRNFNFPKFRRELKHLLKRYHLDGVHFDLSGVKTDGEASDIERIFRWFGAKYPDLKFGVTLSPDQFKQYAGVADLAGMVGIKADRLDSKSLGLSYVGLSVRKRAFLTISSGISSIPDDIQSSMTWSISSLAFMPSFSGDTLIHRYQLQGLLLCQG